MNTKFEQLDDQLFEKQVDEKSMSKIIGGYLTAGDEGTYVTINTDTVHYVDSNAGKFYGPVNPL